VTGEGLSEPPKALLTSVLTSVLTPRVRRVDVAVAVLLAVLGFAAVVQVRSTQADGPLATARQEDLVQILDELANRNDRLRAEVSALERSRAELASGQDSAAIEEARRRAQLLGVLAGSVPARGPGLLLTLTDAQGLITADVLLDTLEELRAAGAEAVQVEGPVEVSAEPEQGSVGPSVRVVASTAFVGGEQGGVVVDGTQLYPPYRFVVVGEPETLASAVGIPGGVVDTVEQRGGTALVEQREQVEVGALRRLEEPRYARPVPQDGD
jgi:uncharacterized protein YlxW (UPF0749 family)